MPIFAVIIKASTAENVNRVAAVDGRDTWRLKIKCDGCDEVSAKFIEVSGQEEVEVDGGISNACFKCKECKKDISVNVLSESVVEKIISDYTRPLASKKNTKYALVALDRNGIAITALDFRGGEPVDLELDDQFVAYAPKAVEDGEEGEDGTPLPDGGLLEAVDLSDEYADYDEASEGAVTIAGAKAVFIKDKNLAVYYSS